MRKRIFPTPDREEILAGHPLRSMAKIGGPAVVSSLLFTLYNLADAFWIGRLPTDHAGTVMTGIQKSWPFLFCYSSEGRDSYVLIDPRSACAGSG